jgi:3-oxoacyl-[acyl-carrier protein] reductase
MDFGIKDRVALVLGAAGGLGGAVAVSLAREGCRIALADVNEAGLASARRAVEATGSPSIALPWNIADRSVPEERIESVERTLGPIDILFNNTGGPSRSLAADTPPEAWIDHFDKMVTSVMAITARAFPSMRRRGWGRIVTSTSSGVVIPIPNLAVSNGLRSALVGWSKTLAREVARDGVNVNVVVPGRIATGRVRCLTKPRRPARDGRPMRWRRVAPATSPSAAMGGRKNMPML